MERSKIFLYLASWLLVIFPAFAQAPENPELNRSQEDAYKLSLEDVTRLALQNNFDIQLARYDAQIARTKQGEAESIYDTIFNAEVKYFDNQKARTTTILGTKNLENDYNLNLSKKLPTGTTVDIDMTNARDWSNSIFATINPSHDSALGVTLGQALGKNFFGVQDRGTVKLTKLDIKNSRYTSLEKIEGSVADVQKAYWDLVLHRERLRVEQRMSEQAKKLFDDHTEKARDGLVETPELLASEANYRKRINEFLLAENDVATKENILRLLLNISDDAAAITPAQNLSVPENTEDISRSLNLAFTNRQDYRKVKNDIEARDIKLAMGRNNLWPEINLEASFARNGIGDHFNDAVKNITQEDNPESFVGVNISFPLENTKARSQWSAAKAEKARALVHFKLVERTIAVGIADQVRTCNVLKTLAVNSAEIAQLQAKKLEAEEKRFEFGRSNTDTIIRFQEDAIQAEWKALQDKFNFLSAQIDLRVKESSLLNQYWNDAK